jgi:hypothetical protein
MFDGNASSKVDSNELVDAAVSILSWSDITDE